MCRWTFLWMLLTSLVVATPEDQQYCAVRYRRLCQGKGRHVACHFPDAGPGRSCESYTPIKFTNELKNFVTHYLNRRRQRIAAGNERVRGGVHLPKPEIMMLVEWDRELAFLAQRLADQCHFVHDDCRATVRYPYAGQTVGEVRWRRSSESDVLSAQRAIRRVLDAWWGERRRVHPKQLTAPFRLTAKGTVWGHFSQLAVWNLQAVGCGAVRHGAHQPRLLLVCDFSHTNMLGQKTLVSGVIAPCPIHTARRPRTAYPLLCAPVRTPVPVESEELELEDIYDDKKDEDYEPTPELGDATPPKLWSSTSDKRWLNQKNQPTTRDCPAKSRKKIASNMYRDFSTSLATLKQTPNHQPYKDLEQKTRNKMQNVNYKLGQNTFEGETFETIARNEWKTRLDHKKPNYGQWRHKQENIESLDEVIPLTIPRREITETLEPTNTDVYRPIIKEDIIPHIPEEVYQPTIREDVIDLDEFNKHPRWRQTRIRHPRPGANALLTCTSTNMLKKEYIQASLKLDKEDIDQLFRDTGFNVHWRKHTT